MDDDLSYEGWVKMHRRLEKSQLWNLDALHFKVAMLLLLNAKWKPEWFPALRGGAPLFLERGQLVATYQWIIDNLGGAKATVQNIRTCIKNLRKIGFLNTQPNSPLPIITICNYELYQQDDREANTQANTHLTGDQQAPNSRLTPIKEVKEVKESGEGKELETELGQESPPKPLKVNSGFAWFVEGWNGFATADAIKIKTFTKKDAFAYRAAFKATGLDQEGILRGAKNWHTLPSWYKRNGKVDTMAALWWLTEKKGGLVREFAAMTPAVADPQKNDFRAKLSPEEQAKLDADIEAHLAEIAKEEGEEVI